MKYPLIVLAVLSLPLVSSCSSVPTPVVTSPRPPIPANLTSPCDRPGPLLSGAFPEVVMKLVELSAKFSECEAKHTALVKAVSDKP